MNQMMKMAIKAMGVPSELEPIITALTGDSDIAKKRAIYDLANDLLIKKLFDNFRSRLQLLNITEPFSIMLTQHEERTYVNAITIDAENKIYLHASLTLDQLIEEIPFTGKNG